MTLATVLFVMRPAPLVLVKFDLALIHNIRSVEGTACFLNIFLSFSLSLFLSFASVYKYEIFEVCRETYSPSFDIILR